MAGTSNRGRGRESGWRTPIQIWFLPLFGLVGALAFSFTEKPFSAAFMQMFGVSLLIAGASFLVGALLGFLFGIPRALRMGDAMIDAQLAKGQRYAGNSNLEQISDWLTKVLIGAGLVQLGALTTQIGDLSNSLGDSLGSTEATASTVALALVLVFFSSGFLVIYLYTRIDFGPLMARTEEEYSPPVAQAPPDLPPPPSPRVSHKPAKDPARTNTKPPPPAGPPAKDRVSSRRKNARSTRKELVDPRDD